jgi:UPF0755 protein
MSDADRPDEETFDARPAKGGLGFARVFLIAVMVAIALALVAAAAGLGAYSWMGYKFSEDGPAASDTTITLPRGSGLISIADQLEREGLISNALIFRAMVTIDGGERDLRAGEYAVPAGASMADLYALFRSGRTLQHPITAPEGLTSAMIAAVVAQADVLAGELGAPPPEGTLLPETYLVDRGTPREELLERMAEAQDALLDELWPNRASDLPFETREEAIILASIVEKETGVASERPLVASVFVNRMRRGMRLESDPTIIYGLTQGEPLGRGLRRSELDDASNPYNTYQNDGLPPTPIANPGRDAIAAVLDPPQTDYLFFVADGTGGHAFSSTYAEHRRNVAEWRRIERERAGR